MNNIKNLGATRRVHILLQGATAYASLMLFFYLNVFCLIVGYRKKNSLANMLFFIALLRQTTCTAGR